MTRSARIYAIVGAVVMVLVAGALVGVNLAVDQVNRLIPQANLFGPPSGPPTAGPSSSPTPAPEPTGNDISGPLNILIAGVDTRISQPNWIPRADSVLIMHVSADHTHAYLTSLPRDLVVDIPAFAPAGFRGERSKLTHAMSFGSRVPGSPKPNPFQGFQLLARTVSAYTGIGTWNGGAIMQFTGLRNLVDAVGGIDVYVDQLTVSIHMAPSGHPRPECASCEHGFSGPRATYTVGLHHFAGWQAIDYARQRYLPGGDYTRGRHQRQIIKAIIAKVVTTDYVSKASALTHLFTYLGSSLVFDGRGHQPLDFAYTLRRLTAANLTLVGLPGSGAYSGGSYLGENLDGVQAGYFAAVRQDSVAAFVKANPGLVNSQA